MLPSPTMSRSLRFGTFQVDLRAGELRKDGRRIPLQEQPFQVLVMLLERPGEVVTRDELHKKLWPENTFVDFDHGVNKAVNKIRTALGDSAETPQFIETLPKHGYRFICPVAAASSPPASGDGDIAATGVGAIHELPPATAAGAPASGDGDIAATGVGAIHELPPVATGGRAIDESPLRARWRLVAAGILFVALAALVAFNVAGLREHVMTAVGASVSRRMPPPKIESLAVLPLVNLSRDPEQEYFSDGMTEELITELARIGSLRVISRTSVMQYKGTKKPLTQIARELNVDAVIEGAVLRAENRVRITAQLIQAKPEKHLWANSYERDLRDVLALQGEVARTITQQVEATVTPQEQRRLARARPVNPEAFIHYLRGRIFLDKDPGKALRPFEEAIEADPTYAPAYSGLSHTYYQLSSTALPPEEAMPKARAALARALALDDSLAEAHTTAGMLLLAWDWDWPGAEREFRRAIELNPNSAFAHNKYGVFLVYMGRFREAEVIANKGLELDPLSPWNEVGAIWPSLYARRYAEAIPRLQRLEQISDFGGARQNLALAYKWSGQCAKAMEQFNEPPTGEVHDGNLAYAIGCQQALGRREQALASMARLEALRAKSKYFPPYNIATAYANLGEKRRALDWLEKAFGVRDENLITLKVDPEFDSLRSDPRFQDLLRRMNFPQ